MLAASSTEILFDGLIGVDVPVVGSHIRPNQGKPDFSKKLRKVFLTTGSR